MPLNSSWHLDEPAELLHIEQWSNAGAYLGTIAYGIHIAIYIFTLHSIWTVNVQNRRAVFSTVAITLLFMGATFNTVGSGLQMQWAFIDYRNYPDGPSGFIMEVGGIWPITLGNFGGCLVTWTADAILLWRCYTVWGGSKIVIGVPALMWVASVAMGVLAVYQCAQPQQSMATLKTINFALSFWSIAAALNILLTVLILVPLFRARQRAVSNLGPEYGRMYTGIAAILIESAAPYAVLVFIWIILYGLQYLGMFFILELLVQVEAIAPELIILRVAHGQAWTRKTTEDLTGRPATIRFAANSGATASTTFGGSRDALGMAAIQRKSSVEDVKGIDV